MHQNRKENHHVIPICMKGADHETNLERITSKNHNLIHKTLNIPHNLLRDFRKRTNERTLRNGERSGAYHKMRKMYFSNLDMLPEDMLHIHNRSFSRQIGRGYKQIGSLTKGAKIEDDFERDISLVNYHDTDYRTHSEYVEAVEWKLYNLMKVDKTKNDLFLEYYLQNNPPLNLNKTG